VKSLRHAPLALKVVCVVALELLCWKLLWLLPLPVLELRPPLLTL
jgi:hypothetical protein